MATHNDNEDFDWAEHELYEANVDKSRHGKGYKRMHTAKGGRNIPIAAMDNQHIENYINLMVEKMQSIKSSALYEVGESGSLFEMELNGVQQIDKGTAIQIISSIMYKLEPYFTELVIRGNSAYIMNISEKLDRILGRSKISDEGRKLLT